MRKLISLGGLAILLSGCGQSEAEKDYERCNDEYADGIECTEEEFRDFLFFEAEDDTFIVGGSENLTDDVKLKILDEIDEKVNEIFE
ncbi:hypothetical protein [Siminovitchia fordii]|uniref:Uncharacterized protein n=1 Tax=Siminovitchia fordii TaxID=254759 RepID=A0ABQ4KA46_9BACI|nr:hypothetical protein [Siminovitchia fordii]GIN22598.1 hypothetical protein J1TS3_37320 [Siminovitchia fordii]